LLFVRVMDAHDDTTWFRQHPLGYVDVGTAEIAYRTIGSGPPLLMVHGWPFSSLSFRALVRRLADRFTCILPDTPGLGETRWRDDTPFGFASQVTTLRTFVDRLGLDRYALVGHDTGGTLARLLALSDPARAGRIVVMNTEMPRHRPPWIPLYQRLAVLPSTATSFGWLLRVPAYRRSSMGYGPCFDDPARLDDDFHACFVAPLLASRRRVEGVMRYLRGIDWRLIDGLAARHRELRQGVLLVWGARDTVFPVTHARAMVAQFDGAARLVEVPDARFLVHGERPDVVADAVRAFLAA
jgi:pimeloyl-ACP methyl ester carboxylesterase